MYNGGGFGSFGDGGGFGGGGGFNNDQSFTSPNGGNKNRPQNTRPQNIMPATVHMMLHASHDANTDIFTYEGAELNLVTFVGVIRDVVEATTSVTYQIDDYTGPNMSVRKFISDAEDTTSLPKSNGYVRVYGNLRSLGDSRNIIAFSVRPLTTHNEITSHMLDVVKASLYHRKKNKVTTMGGMVTASNGNPATNTNGNSDNSLGLNPNQNKVYGALKKATSDIGMSINEVLNQIGGSMSYKEIKNAIEFLSNEGHIYSTIDDEHYKLTDMY